MNQNKHWGKRAKHSSEHKFLKRPYWYLGDLKRFFQIAYDFFKGFYGLRRTHPCVTFFGSARFEPDTEYYQQGVQTAKRTAELGYTVMTGGGPGMMEAANKGAKAGGGFSIGCNIILPEEQHHNIYLDKWIEFKYFFVRKVMLSKYSTAFVVLPGGFGTMDEVFEVITLIQTGKIKEFPIIFINRDFWSGLQNFLKNTFLKNHTVSKSDFNDIFLVDTPDEVEHVLKNYFNKQESKQNINQSSKFLI